MLDECEIEWNIYSELKQMSHFWNRQCLTVKFVPISMKNWREKRNVFSFVCSLIHFIVYIGTFFTGFCYSGIFTEVWLLQKAVISWGVLLNGLHTFSSTCVTGTDVLGIDVFSFRVDTAIISHQVGRLLTFGTDITYICSKNKNLCQNLE